MTAESGLDTDHKLLDELTALAATLEADCARVRLSVRRKPRL